MESVPRHQCFTYEGSPYRNVDCLGKALRRMLRVNYRCLYLNNEAMVQAMCSFLAGAGTDVSGEVSRGRLILSSERGHILNGRFDLEAMMEGLTDALNQALKDGYRGLFATGDMSWEFGPAADFSQLMEYEWRLEEFFQEHPQLSGICQYHANTLPAEVVRQGAHLHPGIFVNEELSLSNPRFVHPKYAPGEMDAVLG